MKYRTPEEFSEGILEGSRLALSKAITLIESERAEDRAIASVLLNAMMPHGGASIRLGITGVPGAGKSTFIEALGCLLAERGHKVAVLAIDPSSTISGGSILADKTRMEKLSTCASAFIRPSPSSSHLGGVARKTRETMILCEAAGFDVVFVETVGVGQSEIAAASMVDFFLVLMIPDAGDELQGIKKGVLEVADAIAVNKADLQNMDKALAAKKVYENALHIISPASKNWAPPVLTCSALEGTGISEIWDTVLKHHSIFTESGELVRKRREQDVNWMWSLLDCYLKDHIFSQPSVKHAIEEARAAVIEGAMTPDSAALQILKTIIASSGCTPEK
jgi:LAO/AO transport system kinase